MHKNALFLLKKEEKKKSKIACPQPTLLKYRKSLQTSQGENITQVTKIAYLY